MMTGKVALCISVSLSTSICSVTRSLCQIELIEDARVNCEQFHTVCVSVLTDATIYVRTKLSLMSSQLGNLRLVSK